MTLKNKLKLKTERFSSNLLENSYKSRKYGKGFMMMMTL